MDPAVLEQNAQLAAQALAIPPIHDPDQVGYFDINGNPHRNQPGNHPKPFEHISCHLYPGLSSLRNAVSFKDGNARNFLRPQGQLGFFTWFLNPESLAARRRIINAPPILVENGLEDLHAVFNQLLEDEESVGANFARANQETCDYYSSEFRQFERFCIVVKRQNDVTKQPFTINLILLFFTWKYLSPHDSNDHLLVQFIQKLRAAAGFDPNEIDLTEIPDRPVTWGKDWPLEFGVPRGNMYKNMNRTLWALKLIHLVCGHDGPYTERKVNGVIITSGNPFKSPLFKEKYRLLERHIEKYAQQSHSAPAIDVLRDLPKVHESQFSNDDNETRLLERINNVTLLKARIPKRLRRGETGGVRRDGIRFPTNRDNPNNLSLDEFGIPRLMTMTIMKQKGRRIGQAVELSDIPKPDPGFCPIRQTIYNVLMDRQILGKDPQFMFCQFDGNGHPIDAPFLNAKEEVDYESRRFKTLMIDSGLVIRIPANEATNTPERIHPLYTSHSPCHTFMRIASICRVPFSDAQQGGRWESKSSALVYNQQGQHEITV
ncbi:hypothetical protein BCR33DRAFT_301383 [Rhizoclosmatium globosum]|uniref:Uncharacterized protein n=1 Tax=Rhizoclosmatium globosum TaxID=329046 RepID=A0A1Y2C6H6_9FUNG|nr:hypothetical protein BCR33DRAFT_301383 [Rhizoclosmatium globosum]|eukprot:ORY42639.1 hypothetical protein BCR33DRAFT_301383 [Rhizoclosmatium globosum]